MCVERGRQGAKVLMLTCCCVMLPTLSAIHPSAHAAPSAAVLAAPAATPESSARNRGSDAQSPTDDPSPNTNNTNNTKPASTTPGAAKDYGMVSDALALGMDAGQVVRGSFRSLVDKTSMAIQQLRQEGLASWYGKAFHGKKTANGETFDMHALTAAHRSLPLSSFARVTNRETGQSVVVRINDRGPYAPGKLIDLSFAAARELGILARGHGEVDVEPVSEAEARELAKRWGEASQSTPRR